MAKNYFISGEWNVICDVCSKKIKAHQARQRWDGFIVCPEDFEHRHPQDFVKAHTDKITVPFTRPRPPDIFIDNGDRNLSDTVSVIDSLVYSLSTSFEDHIVLDDAGQDYIDITYFAQDYVIENGLHIDVYKVLQEVVTVVDSGNVLLNPYIDSTYFAELYVGDYTQF